MQITIRHERAEDHKEVFKLIDQAFSLEPMSDGQEQFLVERLRKSKAFIPELSLVAILGDEIVGHILLTRLKVRDGEKVHVSLALAPVSVLPRHQKKGIGGKLIQAAHQRARELGFQSVILLGHKDYYPRFGYSPAIDFGIELPFEVPLENCMAIELVKGGLKDIKGMVEYPAEFYEQSF